ncbi:ATP-binding cassette sub-family G member 8-like [Lineus longissimus]|uniref:ATP-binding cassette sub-family G member 8-like n=1 Tax=Lineus longissimus TaxID=88925 RepID=UPI00315DB571
MVTDGLRSTNMEQPHHETVLRVDNLIYEVDETSVSIIHRLAAFQMPWEWCQGSTSRVRVLNDVSFTATGGHMLAILGSSGSGKTSLLDVLACRNTGGLIRGQIALNGQPVDQATMRDCSAYVKQDDCLLEHLTVRETLTFVAHLKLPANCPSDKIEEQVEHLMAELGLSHVSSVKVGGEKVRGVSGGERRRVSIAMQMLLDPDILFLDEPTSGLDSFTAYNIVALLSSLAQRGKLVILTIHQPRSNIFELFDQVMVLSQGNMVYHGLAKEMEGYFHRLGYPCPELTNPCDFFVDLATVDMTSPKTESETRRRMDMLVDAYGKYRSRVIKNDTPPSVSVSEEASNETSAGTVHAGPVKQFSILCRRAFRNHIEDYGFLAVQAVIALAMSFLIGLIYFQLTNNQFDLRDRFALMFLIGALYPYNVVLDVVGEYHKERRILFRETNDGLYTVGPYFFSKVLSELPEHSVFVMLYVIPVYWLANLQPDPILFLRTYGITYILVYCSRSMAYVGAALLPTYHMSVLVAQFFFTFSFLSAGYVINLTSIWEGMKWSTNVSYLRWGYLALAQTQFKGLNFTCEETIPGVIPCIKTGEQALTAYSVNDFSVEEACLILIAFIFVLLALFYICLRCFNQKPHES